MGGQRADVVCSRICLSAADAGRGQGLRDQPPLDTTGQKQGQAGTQTLDAAGCDGVRSGRCAGRPGLRPGASGLCGNDGRWAGVHAFTNSTFASAAMPSPRPAKPRCSVVVALTLTCSARALQSAATFCSICLTCGARRGACAMSVASMLPSAYPAARAALRTRSSSSRAETDGSRRPCRRGRSATAVRPPS